MTKEILLVAEAVSNEKGVSEDIIFEAIELALATATKKRYDEESDITVTIDRETGDYVTKRRWLVVPDEELALLGTQFTTEEAAEQDASLQPGDIYEEVVDNIGFGRIAAQTAKQVIVQRVRDAERAQVVEQYMDRIGELVAGTVKKVTRDNVIVDLGNNAEGLLPREQLVGRETFRVNDRVRAILKEISTEARGPQLILSRACPEMLVELFKIEVPEIAEEVIQIRAAARDPGQQTVFSGLQLDNHPGPFPPAYSQNTNGKNVQRGQPVGMDGRQNHILRKNTHAELCPQRRINRRQVQPPARYLQSAQSVLRFFGHGCG